MNTRLKNSIETAERSLPEEGQEQLASLVDLFTANFARNPQADFAPEELEHLKTIAAEPFIEADPKAVAAIFAKHGA